MTQIEYIAIPFDDCGFVAAQRRDFLALRFGGRRYTDELTPAERSSLIEDLKSRKCVPARVADELQAKVKAFEKASGIKISSGWQGGAEVGAAVNRGRDNSLTFGARARNLFPDAIPASWKSGSGGALDPLRPPASRSRR